MANENRGAETMEQAREIPTMLHLIPNGAFKVKNGGNEPTVSVRDAAGFIAASFADQPEIPIRYFSDLIPGQGIRPLVSGWIVALESRTDGIWGSVRWTPEIAQEIAAGQYRFLTVEIAHNANGDALRISGAALSDPARAQEIISKLGQVALNTAELRSGFMLNLAPLSAAEVAVCGAMGISERAFRANNQDRMGRPQSTDAETAVCAQLGLSPAQFTRSGAR